MKYTVTIIRILFLALFINLMITGNTMLWLALFGASLILAIFFGRLYCGYACPINTAMIPIEWLSKKLNIQTDKTPKWLEKGFFPWVFLVVSIALMLISKKVMHINLPIILIWLGIAVLVTLRYKPFVFHNLICPFGALQKTFGKFAIFSKNVDKNSCVGCKKCIYVCPSDAISFDDKTKKSEIDKNLCLQCTNCTDICPESAIDYVNLKK